MDVKSETIETQVIAIRLSVEQANKLVGLLDSVPTKDPFFSELAGLIDGQHGELAEDYVQDADGDYVVSGEIE